MTIQNYFLQAGTQEILKRAASNLRAIVPKDQEKVELLAGVLQDMTDEARLFDEYCQFNISWIGNALQGQLLRVAQSTQIGDDAIDALYAAVYRFTIEMFLSWPGDQKPSITRFNDYAIPNLAKFISSAQIDIQWARMQMPIFVFKQLLNTEALVNIQKIEPFRNEVSAKIKALTDDLIDREQRAGVLKDALDKYREAFNFVGLTHGFKDLSDAKRAEISQARVWLVAFGMLSLVPLSIELVMVYLNLGRLEELKWHLVVSVLPALSLTVLFIYFFRIALRASDSAKSQLLQIELRKTLCRFIQDYANYAKSLKESNAGTLEKFENVIFAGIVSSDEKLPATFDGIEQLTNMVKAMRS